MEMKFKETIAICVPLKDAEKVRKYLYEKKLLRNDLRLNKDKEYIYFPVKEISKEFTFHSVIKKSFQKKEAKPTSYKETVLIPGKLKHELPTSYDIIGDIILVKLSKNLLKYQKEIGESLLKSNKNIKTVCLIEPVGGEFRTRNIKMMAGEKRTTTTHTEYGLTFNVDVKNTYFSPRLATERKRVASLVKQGEIVVDMFAGVAPFSIMIAKYANPKIVYAIDKNLEAVKYAQENIRRNNVLDKIEILHADAREVPDILNKKDVKADRIIMNLPFSAHLFFVYTLRIMKDYSIIHYYDILEKEKIEERINALKKIAEKNKTTLTNLDVRKIKTYAPREFYIGIDITARKMPM
jgi:tRNA (guanine37-N1)-methyltransferase